MRPPSCVPLQTSLSLAGAGRPPIFNLAPGLLKTHCVIFSARGGEYWRFPPEFHWHSYLILLPDNSGHSLAPLIPRRRPSPFPRPPVCAGNIRCRAGFKSWREAFHTDTTVLIWSEKNYLVMFFAFPFSWLFFYLFLLFLVPHILFFICLLCLPVFTFLPVLLLPSLILFPHSYFSSYSWCIFHFKQEAQFPSTHPVFELELKWATCGCSCKLRKSHAITHSSISLVWIKLKRWVQCIWILKVLYHTKFTCIQVHHALSLYELIDLRVEPRTLLFCQKRVILIKKG